MIMIMIIIIYPDEQLSYYFISIQPTDPVLLVSKQTFPY